MEANNRTAIAILRLVNTATKFKDPMAKRRYIIKKLGVLNDQQIESLGKAIKSMILMTSGNVKSVRDPNLYSKADAQPWSSITSSSAMSVLSKIPGYEQGSYPTREDYETAKRLLPILGSSFMDFDEIQALTGGEEPEEYRQLDAMVGFKKLYRGLKNMDISAIKFLMTNPKWDMKRGVSTSYNIGEAKYFSGTDIVWGSTRGPSILFGINNPKKKGFIADKLSEFEEEAEVILSGMLDVEDWIIEARAKCSFVGNELISYGDSVSNIEIKKVSGENILSVILRSGPRIEVKVDDNQLRLLLDRKIVYVDNLFDDSVKKKLGAERSKRITLKLLPKNLVIKVNATLE